MTNKAHDVRNNWPLLLGVSFVSFLGAATYAVVGENSAFIGLYFIVASFCLAGFTWWWFAEHPPALLAKPWKYVATVLALEFGAFFAGGIEETRAIGAWVAVGLAFVVYGILERSNLISITGLLAFIASVTIYVQGPANLGVILEIITGFIFLASALLLKSRPSKQESLNPSS